MDPRMLLAPPSPLGYPAPFWFIELFKVLGFFLHIGPMHLWYAGSITAVLMYTFGRGHSKTAATHVFKALPLVIALGINFGIVPLLFTQVAYYQFFYVAGILIAWPWFSVIILLIGAYYGAYLNVLGVTGRFSEKTGRVAAWISAVSFIVIGFLFANNFSLMTNTADWFDIFMAHNVAGAPTGMALNTGDPTLPWRWLFMFGMAFTTLGAFFIADAGLLSGKETDDYRRYSCRLAWKLYTLGLVLFAAFGSAYIFGTKMEYVRLALANPVMRIIFPLTMASPIVPWVMIWFQRNGTTRRFAIATIVAQLGVLALNAVSRQWVQNMEIAAVRDLAAERVDTQLGAIIFFLVVFAAGLAVTGWMLSKVFAANRANA